PWPSASPGSISPIAYANSGSERTADTQRRRSMNRSSVSSADPAVTVRGSSAMPHLGHVPGPIWTTSGCIGQVYSSRLLAAVTSECSWSIVLAPFITANDGPRQALQLLVHAAAVEAGVLRAGATAQD